MLDRRQFLRLTGAAAGLGVAGACTRRTPAPRPTSPTPSVASPSPSSAGPVPWSELRLTGPVVRPGDAGYDGVRLLFNPRFDDVRPAAVARCASVQDVQRCVAFATEHTVPLALRSGGHSYGGWSTGPGLVIDVTALATVTVAGDTVTVGPGAQLVDVYDTLAGQGRAIAAGSCPTVGIGGLTLGGGIGVLSRAWGLTCDSLTAAEVVTADGALRRCDAGNEPDLFWACRGGGGGSFGVVTSLSLRTRPAAPVTVAFLRWDWRRAAAVLAAWQALAPTAPDAVWSNCHLLSQAGSATPKVTIGVAALDANAAAAFIAALTARAGTPTGRFVSPLSYRSAMLLEAGCADRTVLQCHLTGPSGGQLPRAPFAAKSAMFTRALPAAGISAVVVGVERRQTNRGWAEGGVAFDALGGAVGRVAPAATAFPHRRALFSAQYTAGWQTADSPATVTGNLAWLRALHADLQPYASGGAYQNYADPDLAGYPAAYWGANYPRLQAVKAKYDPYELFTSPQAVRPA
ncbi:MAG: FAD-binding oxidoreductase [Actinomycetota bacterium]|nr:FAD-binding oxidoreductase [Actinomycetota bacterium]